LPSIFGFCGNTGDVTTPGKFTPKATLPVRTSHYCVRKTFCILKNRSGGNSPKQISKHKPEQRVEQMEISIVAIPSERSGDWHDKPLRYAVNGPGNEVQKFPTKRSAENYRTVRRKAATMSEAIAAYVARP
jgi:hypothetical protein